MAEMETDAQNETKHMVLIELEKMFGRITERYNSEENHDQMIYLLDIEKGLKNALMDVCEEIETGATLSEAMAKSPKVFNRLYVNMIKAGEAGGALEIILQRLADFMERSQALKRKVQGAMIYPCVVVTVAVLMRGYFGICA